MDETTPATGPAAQEERTAAAVPLIATARFSPGDLLSSRYRIVRTLGEARLDELYEAEDTRRNESVALRVLRRDDMRGDQGLRRLGRIVARLAKLSHPGVARVYDLGWHVIALDGGVEERVVFVTTEILRGETFTQRVRRCGPFPIDEAAVFFTGLCGALEAIHRARVIHGDINGSSVVFAETPEGLARPVITDFSFITGGENEPFEAGRVVGSPAYRAPEQLTGRQMGRGADIFSLGAVMYEAITGRLPFTGGNLLALDFRQLEETPRPPSEVVPAIPPAWERAILRCLARAPEGRFDRATEVLRAMAGEEIPTPRRRQNIRTFSLTALLICVMIGGSVLLSRLSMMEEQRLEAARVLRTRPSIAVLPLRDDLATPGNEWISIALQELIRIEIARDERIRVAPGDSVAAAIREARPGASETPGPTDLRHLRVVLGAEQIVVGSWRSVRNDGGPAIVLDLCVQDTRTGETVGAVMESGHPDELVALSARAAERLRAITGMRGNPPIPDPIATHGWTSAGLRSYSTGLIQLENNDAEEAARSLDAAVRADPHLPFPRAALSSAWWRLGRVSDAVAEAAQTVEESSRLPREESLELEARLAELRAEWTHAIAVYGRLVRSYPDRVEHGLKLVSALLRNGDVDKARDAIRGLRTIAVNIADPRFDLFEARAASQSGRYTDARVIAHRAAETAALLGAKQILAECLTEEALAAAAEGDLVASKELFSRAEAVFTDLRNIDELASVAALRATVDQRHRKLHDAIAELERAEHLYESIGQRQGAAATRGSLALLLADQGRHREALPLFQSALGDFLAIGDLANARRSRAGLAESSIAVGDLVSAEAQLDETLSSARRDGDRAHEVVALLGLARVFETRGQYSRAGGLIDDAESIIHAVGFTAARAEVERHRAAILRMHGELDAAGRELLAAYSLMQELQDPIAAWKIRVDLAEIDLDRGRRARAIASAAQAAEFFASVDRDSDRAWALIVVARAMTETGDSMQAATALDTAGAIERRIDDFELRAMFETAQIRARRGDPSLLLRLADDAASRGFFESDIEARLEAARIAANRGNGVKANAILDVVDRKAAAAEAKLFVDKVAAIRGLLAH